MHKYTPLNQFLYMGAEETLEIESLATADYQQFAPCGDSMDNIVCSVGQKLAKQLQELRVFMVSDLPDMLDLMVWV